MIYEDRYNLAFWVELSVSENGLGSTHGKVALKFDKDILSQLGKKL